RHRMVTAGSSFTPTGATKKGNSRAPPCPFGPPGGILPEARLPPTRTDSHRWTAKTSDPVTSTLEHVQAVRDGIPESHEWDGGGGIEGVCAGVWWLIAHPLL